MSDDVAAWEYLSLGMHRDVPAGAWLVSTSDGLFRDTRMSVEPGVMVQRLQAEGWGMISGEPTTIGTADTFVAAFKRPKARAG